MPFPAQQWIMDGSMILARHRKIEKLQGIQFGKFGQVCQASSLGAVPMAPTMLTLH
jgi:hypothetical protein